MSLAEDIKARVIIEQINLLRFDAREARTLRKRMRELESELIALLAKIDPTIPKRKTFRQRRLERMLKEARILLKRVYSDLSRQTMLRNALLAAQQVAMTAQELNILLGASVITNVPAQSRLLALGREMLIDGAITSSWWSTQEREMQERFVRAIRRGMAVNETLPELINRIRGTRANGFRDGIMSISTTQARNLIRSSIVGVVNEGRLELYRNNADVISRIQWSATLDSRTTEICVGLNGLTWTNPDYEPVGHSQEFPGPVAHWGERSTQVPIVAAFDAIKGPVKRKLDKGMRPTLTGEIPTDVTGIEWLNQQSKETQIAILGVGKQKLLEQGTLTIRDLIDQSNRPLTLSALQARLLSEDGAFPGILDLEKSKILAQQFGLTMPELFTLGLTNRQILLDIASEFESDSAFPKIATLKTRARTLAKIVSDYGGEFGRVTDIVRGGFTVLSPETADDIVKALASRYNIYDKGWRATIAGYADRGILIQFPNGQVGELQFWTDRLFDAKEGRGHQIYEELFELGDGPEFDDERRRLIKESIEFYENEVWSKLDETWDFLRDLLAAATL